MYNEKEFNIYPFYYCKTLKNNKIDIDVNLVFDMFELNNFVYFKLILSSNYLNSDFCSVYLRLSENHFLNCKEKYQEILQKTLILK